VTRLRSVTVLALLSCLGLPSASRGQAGATAAAAPQTQADDYTSYELLGADTHKFRILYDVTATTPGATHYFNVIRKGSVASDERVTDLATGLPLPFEVVPGADARKAGHPTADLDTEYVKVKLARPVPPDGEQRIRIDKTYLDAKSYFTEDGQIVFSRSLGIKRNKVVLPAGYALVACNMPSQVFTESDGRIAIGFFNINPDAVSLVVRARPARWTAPAPSARAPSSGAALPAGTPTAAPSLEASASARIADRAFQDREIVYHLQQPDTHAFDLYHDYTEAREGTDRYVNVVRGGSRVSNASAVSLDTGEKLAVETLKGEAITRAGIAIGEPVSTASEVVVVRFPAVKRGRSMRLRIRETYTDPGRYGEVAGALVWRRTFGRPRNAVVLPSGWLLAASSAPATVRLTDDGRTRLDLENPRLDDLDVLIRAFKEAGRP
jgi:hypothetical protein